jgi:Dolichyl-phosphate-mannose-protein mannosyltransferase
LLNLRFQKFRNREVRLFFMFIKNKIDGQFEPSVTPLLFLAFIFYCLISSIIGNPIFGSDEYAYFISGKNLNRLPELYALDPGLQQVNNVLYFKVINLWSKLVGPNLTSSFRVLHCLEYVCTGLILYKSFKSITGASSAYLAIAAFLLLPATVYIYSVMPETELVLLTACLCYVCIRVYPRRPYFGAALQGLIVGSALLIKPHAAALLLATAAFLVFGTLGGVVKAGYRKTVWVFGVFILSSYISLVLIWGLCSAKWSLDPSVMLGLKFYGQYLESNPASQSILSKVFHAAGYFTSHLIVIGLVFSPVLIWLARQLFHIIFSPANTPDDYTRALSAAALFVSSMLFSHLAMAAWFTAGAAEQGAEEAMRLHGRYLGPAIALLPFLYFHALRELGHRGQIAVKAVFGIAILGCLFYLFAAYKIFPWDYPLLFAFYNKAPYWVFEEAIPFLRGILVIAMMAMIVVVSVYKSLFAKTFSIQLFIILIAGSTQTYTWMNSHTKSYSRISELSRAIGAMTGDNEFGKGLVISADRYGPTSYMLYSLGNSPRVVTKPVGSKLTNADLANADWALVHGDYSINFDHFGSISLGELRFYPLHSKIAIEVREKPLLKPGEQVKLALGAGYFSQAKLLGFNDLENWGGWTALERSEIVLPMKVQGTVKVRLFSWSIYENLNSPLTVSLGSSTADITLTDKGKEYEITLDVDQPTDRLAIQSAVFHPANSHRSMGVAIGNVSITR